jgi:predicted Zn-dependent protease
MEPVPTKTLAEIYLRQGHLQEAYKILKSLSEKDPFNQEAQERLREVSERLGISNPSKSETPSSLLSEKERIRMLKRWLANIQEERRK